MELLTACLYTYLATVTAVYDGDTITADIDLGLNTWRHGEKIRLARIDAPEVRGEERPEGLKCRDLLQQRIDGKQITIRTVKDRKGKFGRYLGELWDQDGNVNDWLVSQGCAEYREY